MSQNGQELPLEMHSSLAPQRLELLLLNLDVIGA